MGGFFRSKQERNASWTLGLCLFERRVVRQWRWTLRLWALAWRFRWNSRCTGYPTLLGFYHTPPGVTPWNNFIIIDYSTFTDYTNGQENFRNDFTRPYQQTYKTRPITDLSINDPKFIRVRDPLRTYQ